MFGCDASQVFSDAGYKVINAKKTDFDVTNLTEVRKFFAACSFDFVLHAAAYTNVDAAESNRELAFLVNGEGAKNVAIASKEKSLPVIYISTDYVFDGEKKSPYSPRDKTNPINVYGASKLTGEEGVRKENQQHYIIRTSWLYGKNGKNFVDTMVALSHKQSTLKVVADQFGCPTWTMDLAIGIKNLIEKKSLFGIYHICGSGVASWHGFAKKIFEIIGAEIDVIAVTSDEFLRIAKRPKFSAMSNGESCRAWEEALKEYLSQKFKLGGDLRSSRL